MIRVIIEDTETHKRKGIGYDTERLKKQDIPATFFAVQAMHMINQFLHELKYDKKGDKKP